MRIGTNSRFRFCRLLVAASAISIAAIGGAPAAYAQEATKRFNVPAQPMAKALLDLGRQAGVSISAPSETTRGKRSKAVSGDMTTRQALARLLEGSGLRYEFVNGSAVRVFAGSVGNGGTSGSQAASTVSGGTQSETESAEIIVTGTRIAGEAPVGAPLVVYGRKDIERSGAATIDQFARTMTMNLSNSDTIANPGSSATFSRRDDNLFGGAAFNLRGIGPTSTLTLINGNRLPSAGLDGGITDISMIPLSIVKRIEVVPDGSSAIYGADAVAGVVNIITDTSFEGAETSVRYGFATEGGARQVVASQALGTSWGSGGAMISYEFNKQYGLDASRRDYLPDLGGPHSLVPENKSHGIFAMARQSIGDATELSASFMYGDRDGEALTHLHSDFTVTDTRAVNSVRQIATGLSIKHDLSKSWSVSLSGNYAQSKQRQTSDVLSSSFSGTTDADVKSELKGVDFLARGSLFDLAGGAVKTAVGASYREETFANSVLSGITFFGQTFTSAVEVPKVDRNVKSIFAEVLLPIIGGSADGDNPRLTASGAVRYDDYSDVGSATIYKLGLSARPIPGLQIRSSYGTSFRSPLLSELHAAVETSTALFADPTNPLGTSTLVIAGGNPNLRPERSTSFTAGVDFQPAFASGLTASVTYFNIDFEDRIDIAPVTGSPLASSIAAPFVRRSPSLAEVEAYFSSPGFLGDFAGAGASGVGAIWDSRRTNLATTRQEGLDVTASYAQPTAVGQFVLAVASQYLFRHHYQVVAALPSVTRLNRYGSTPRFKARGSLSWSSGQFDGNLAVNYVNGYRNGLGESSATVGSPQRIRPWTTADLYLSYSFDDDSSFGKGLKFAVSVTNVTNERPPFAEIPSNVTLQGQRVLPFDPVNASPVGRVISLQVIKRW